MESRQTKRGVLQIGLIQLGSAFGSFAAGALFGGPAYAVLGLFLGATVGTVIAEPIDWPRS